MFSYKYFFPSYACGKNTISIYSKSKNIQEVKTMFVSLTIALRSMQLAELPSLFQAVEHVQSPRHLLLPRCHYKRYSNFSPKDESSLTVPSALLFGKHIFTPL